MVVCNVATECHFDLLRGAMAVELAARLVGITLRNAVVNRGMNGNHVDDVEV